MQILKTYKKPIIIACAAIILCSFAAATILSRRMEHGEQEPVPPGRIYDAGAFGEDIVVHDSTEGEIVIKATSSENSRQPETVTEPSINLPRRAGGHTGGQSPAREVRRDEAERNRLVTSAEVTRTLEMANGSIGVLTIPKLALSVNVYESPDNMEAMSKGVAHFPSTSAWDGNVALSAHNINLDGSDGYFKYLYTLEKGDSVTYQTALGERAYTVESVATIAASDWTPLGYTDDNRLTMITCISGQPDKRLCVTVIEKYAE